jgi:CHAD domain-containing protein
MAPDVLDAALAKQLTQCARELARARRGVPRGVHQARVASRRLREGLGALTGVLPGDTRRRATRVLRKLGQTLGPVRECDVTMMLISSETERCGWTDAPVAELLDVLQAERAKHHRALLKVMEGVEWPAAFRQIRKRLRGVGTIESRRVALTSAAARRIKRAATLSADVSVLGAVYVPDQLHAVRIAAKKLRYALEWEQQIGGKRWVRERRVLEAVQEDLGAWHDRLILQERIHRLRRAGEASKVTAGHFKHMAADLERECRARHAAILARVRSLSRVAEGASR